MTLCCLLLCLLSMRTHHRIGQIAFIVLKSLNFFMFFFCYMKTQKNYTKRKRNIFLRQTEKKMVCEKVDEEFRASKRVKYFHFVTVVVAIIIFLISENKCIMCVMCLCIVLTVSRFPWLFFTRLTLIRSFPSYCFCNL